MTVGVAASLLTVALCHYLSNARVPYSMPVGRAPLPLPRRCLRCLVKQLLLELPKPVSVGYELEHLTDRWALTFKGRSEVVALLGSLTSTSPTDCSYLWMNPPIVTPTRGVDPRPPGCASLAAIYTHHPSVGGFFLRDAFDNAMIQRPNELASCGRSRSLGS